MGASRRLSTLLKKPVPLWAILIVIISTAGFVGALTFFPGLLSWTGDFSITVDPLGPVAASNDSQLGGGGATTIHIEPVRNFTGIVSLQILSPPGINTRFSGSCTGSIAIVFLGPKTDCGIGVSAITAGNYTLSLKGVSGSLSHLVIVPVFVQQVTLTFRPTVSSSSQGTPVTSIVTVSSLNGISGNVSFSASPNNYPCDSWPCNLLMNSTVSPQSILLPPNSSKTVNVTFSSGEFTYPETYSVTLAAHVCCNQLYTWDGTFIVNLTYAPENLALAGYHFNSPTNVTLSLKNNGLQRDEIGLDQINDTLGNSFSGSYGRYGPLLPVTTTTSVNLLITYGPIRFMAGGMYVIALTTTRGNVFPFRVTY